MSTNPLTVHGGSGAAGVLTASQVRSMSACMGVTGARPPVAVRTTYLRVIFPRTSTLDALGPQIFCIIFNLVGSIQRIGREWGPVKRWDRHANDRSTGGSNFKTPAITLSRPSWLFFS